MSKHTIYLCKKDLIRMLEIAEKLQKNDNKSFKVEYNYCEIGHAIDMIIETTVEGINGELRVSIVNASDW